MASTACHHLPVSTSIMYHIHVISQPSYSEGGREGIRSLSDWLDWRAHTRGCARHVDRQYVDGVARIMIARLMPRPDGGEGIGR